MAVETVKSTAISNRDATPVVATNASLVRAHLTEAMGKAAVDSAASIASKYILAQVPSNARISQILLSCTAITSGAADIGLYRTTADGSAVVDADFFASAQSIAAALSNSDVTYESGVITVANSEKEIWEALGLSEDPNYLYDVVITLTAAATAAGSVALKVRYAV